MKLSRNNIVFFILLFFMITGSGLRLIRTGTSSMWVDEANTFFAAKCITETGVPNMPTGNVYGRAPLYTYSVAFAFQCFGVSLENARMTSAVFGILSILLAFVVATLLFDWRVGLVTAFFMTFSSFEIGWSRVARMYTQFQFMTLLSVLFFILGYERQIIKRHPAQQNIISRCFLKEFRFGVFEGVDFIALLIFIMITATTYFGVHLLTGFTVLGLVVYILICTLKQIFYFKGRERWLNKYSIVSLMILMGSGILFPRLIHMAEKFLSYLPAWAQEGSSANRPWTLFEFLFSWYRFPLGLLFIWGLIQTLIKRHRSGWIAILLFITPLIILTFVAKHRHVKYLFFVFPFFLMIAAYGLIRVLELNRYIHLPKIRLFKRNFHWLIPGLIILIFIISPWLRIAKNIPWFEDGMHNGAVYFNEWREAAKIMDKDKRSGDLIISSLPEVLLYYNINSDWALNWNNYDLSSKRIITDSQGRIMEVYAGKPLIDSLGTLKRLKAAHPRGWIILTEYHFKTRSYVPPEIREYIEKNFSPPQLTKHKTMVIYHWDHDGVADAL